MDYLPWIRPHPLLVVYKEYIEDRLSHATSREHSKALHHFRFRGFLKLEVPVLGVPILRIIVFWGLYCAPKRARPKFHAEGTPLLLKLHTKAVRKKRVMPRDSHTP